MDEQRLLFKRVEFQTDVSSYGIGLVIAHVLATDELTVIDEDDGSIWKGNAELVEVLD